jgi:peptidoglycan/LPS O-acetylase OafA/YrhL
VIAVLLYHAGVPGVDGGLLGVDVFFVLSGFLITSLVCGEFAAGATIRLGRFWAGRARRLLPGLVILLLGVALYAWLFSGSLDVSTIRGDALATALYVANWHFLVTSQGYFAQAAAPSPLLHTWSLAVEEQYYLVWPVMAVVVLRRGGRRALAWVAGIGAVASALEMASLYLAGASTDRLYYGTDTRAQALLIGSVLGALATGPGLRMVRPAWAGSREGRATGAVLAAGGAGVLVWAWSALNGLDPLLYQGGFFLVALAAAAVIVAVTNWPGGLLARVLAVGPLAFVGRISYGLYLYHWPLFLAVDHAHSGLSGVPLLATRLALTFVVAVVSWRLVEEPIRRRRFLASWRAGLAGTVAVVGTAVVVVVATTVPSGGASPAPAVTASGVSPSIPAAETAGLRARHAFTTDPERFVLLGDSVALTLRLGLQIDSVRRYGVKMYPGAWLGCDLDPNLPVMGNGVVNETSPGCLGWPTKWPRFVDEDRATVVGILLGRFELLSHFYKGRWTYVGQREWDEHLTAELDLAISLVSRQGARVALFTAPYDSETEAADGSVLPENEPSRVDAYNRLLEEVAAAHRGVVTLVDLNRILDPAGHYTETVDGVRVRYYDGVHITIAGGLWLQSRLLPEIARLGLEDRAA